MKPSGSISPARSFPPCFQLYGLRFALDTFSLSLLVVASEMIFHGLHGDSVAHAHLILSMGTPPCHRRASKT